MNCDSCKVKVCTPHGGIRHKCVPEDPFQRGKHDKACHPMAKNVGGDWSGEDYKCPVCGTIWTEWYDETA